MTRQPFITAGIITALVAFASPQFALAGECKVKEPTAEAITDALKIGTVFDVQMSMLAEEYKEKTGKELKVVLVSRAGQNMKDVLTLRDVDRRGRVLSLNDIVSHGENQVYPNAETGGREIEQVKSEIRKAFGDRSRQSIYSHMGILLRNHPAGKDEEEGVQRWYFRHMLRPCVTADKAQQGFDPNKPELFDEDIFRFFTDDPHELRAQILVPSYEIQENLEKLVLPKFRKENGKIIADNSIPKSFNAKFYNAAAHWRNKTEANSNQWVMELVAAATQPFGRVRNRAEAQEILEKTGYRPMRALLSGAQALAALPLASSFAPYVRLHQDEQPAYSQYAIADVITTLSIEEWLKRNNWIELEKMVYVADKTKPMGTNK